MGRPLLCTWYAILTNWYLEIKIEEWPSRAKWGQTGQMVPNGANQGEMGSNRAIRGHIGPSGAKSGQKGQTGPNEAKWGQMGLIFCMHADFYEIKKSYLATQALRLKLAKL